MPHKHYIIALLVLCTAHSVKAMNEENKFYPIELTIFKITQSPPVEHEDLLTRLDEKINNAFKLDQTIYSLLNFFESMSVTEEDAFFIIEMVHSECPNNSLTTQLLEDLQQKNSFFELSIKHFINLATEDLKNVTSETLKIIEDTTAEQPTPQLNKLPQEIKTYIMHCALNSIDCTYSFPLKHESTVKAFDICPQIDTAATNTENGTLYLWDLNKAINKKEAVASNEYYCGLQFNKEGSLLAGAEKFTPATCIRIWNMATKQKTHTVQAPSPMYHMDFLDQSAQPTLCTFSAKNDVKSLHLWQLDDNAQPQCIGTLPVLPWTNGSKTNINPKSRPPYTGTVKNPLTVTITKNRCLKLYLCTKAIKNSFAQLKAENITASNSYKKSVEAEQYIIDNDIKKHREFYLTDYPAKKNKDKLLLYPAHSWNNGF
jgi:hypothetical protein